MSGLTKLKAMEARSATGRGKQLLLFGVFITLVLIGVVFFAAFQNARSTRIALEEDVRSRQQSQVESRTFAMNSWINQSVDQAKHFANSELIQLFASEVDKMNNIPMLFDTSKSGSADDDDQPSSRLPLMRTQLVEFASYRNFESGRIVNSKGEVYLSTETGLPPLNDTQMALVKKVVSTGKVTFGPVTKNRNGLSLEMYLPVFPPMYEEQGGKPASVIIFSQIIGPVLNSFLQQDMTEKDRWFSLVQRSGDGFQTIMLEGLQIKPVTNLGDLDANLVFTMRQSSISDEIVYSSGMRLSSIDWWVVAEEKASRITNASQEHARTVYILAGLVSLALVLMISATWWWLIGREQSSINAQFKELLVVIENQKKLLDGINNTMDDPISFTDSKGVYRYVNKAFAQVVGREEDEVTGLDTAAVLGFDTAKRLNLSDQHVLMTGEPTQVQDILWLQSKRYIFQITKSPMRDSQTRTPQGVVSVYRDITQLVETQEKSRRVVQQTIDALVGTIEQADPFLGGHSRIMGSIASLMSRQLRLPDPNIATIEAAANLSQIGKMFVPREILLKPGMLTPEEKAEMELHVEHSRQVLKNIEFDLPVVDAIYQLNERLDGKGYPQKLQADQISIDARVLAVANAFAAMARPRVYRPALPVHEVLSILESQKGAYDQEVVAALTAVLETPAGQRVVEEAALTKAV